MSEMKEAVIVAYGRSAIGKARKGYFVKSHPTDWASQVLLGVLAKIPQLKPEDIDDVIVGAATPAGQQGMNIARLIVNRAGLPDSVPGVTVSRFCSSGLQSVAFAANSIMANQADVIVAGGIEKMSMPGTPPSADDFDVWFAGNYPQAFMPMGITAENVAKKYGITREMMDQMAVESHAKAQAATESGQLTHSIIPVTVKDIDGNEITPTKDEGIRPGTNMESLAGLKSCFIPPEKGGSVTAATSSQTSDGCGFVVLMSREKAESLGIKPLAKFVGFAAQGCDPAYMGLGPMYAVPKLLKRLNMTVEDMDVIELNEAFASQSLVCMKELGFPKEKVNPWGGALALGHPLGGTGAILVSKALDYLEFNDKKRALVTMCIGGGMGAAAVLERL